ncbi:sorting nexin-16 [Ischnura elegans]|uniref:sorting nexin-16 n=1 Tax=Ischnura elegans TaxID=197161 RepID=UPI001ED8BA1D|nr:sorting nexin-16 [Ischnura elegans]
MAELPEEIPDLSRIKPSNGTESVDLGSIDNESSQPQLLIPIVGYEVMEERARFTVFKLRIENMSTGDMWFVYRRYTDFFRLYSKLRGLYPGVKLPLPRKRWFGDNFDPTFLDERVVGLQNFIDSLLSQEELLKAQCTRDFFCLDDPPSYNDSVEETRAMLDAMEDTIFQLKHQLKEKESDIDRLKEEITVESRHKEHLFSLIQEAIQDCPQCSKEFARITIMDNPELRKRESSSERRTIDSDNMELANLDQ